VKKVSSSKSDLQGSLAMVQLDRLHTIISLPLQPCVHVRISKRCMTLANLNGGLCSLHSAMMLPSTGWQHMARDAHNNNNNSSVALSLRCGGNCTLFY